MYIFFYFKESFFIGKITRSAPIYCRKIGWFNVSIGEVKLMLIIRIK